MSERLFDALDVCLAALRSGATQEACLALFPDLSDELRPALQAAQAAQALAAEAVPQDAIQRSRRRLLGRATWLRGRRLPGFSLIGWPRAVLASLAVIAALSLGMGGLMAASAQSLPGDPLYPVKRVSEDLQLGLAPIAGDRHALESDYALRRSVEVRDLLRLGRVERVSFTGLVSRREGRLWLVDGLSVRLAPDTPVSGAVEVGVTVEVEGETQPGGYLLAHDVRLKAYQMSGVVQAIRPDRWTVGGVQIALSPDTAVSPGVAVGDSVTVLMEVDTGGPRAQAILLQSKAAPAVTAPTGPSESTQPEPTEEGAEVEFTGPVQSIGASAWIVDGRHLAITPQTEIESGIAPGELVKVKAQVGPGGALTAIKIENATEGGSATESGDKAPTSEPTQSGESDAGSATSGTGGGDTQELQQVSLEGTLQFKGGSVWTVDGREVRVDGSTEIDGDPSVGDTVKVDALRQADGSLYARKIQKED